MRPRQLVPLFALAALATAPAIAEAGFAPAQTISETGSQVVRARAVVDPAGNAIAVWGSQTAAGVPIVRARRIAADGTLGPILDISDGITRGTGPAIAITSTGRAFVAWADSVSTGDPTSLRGRWIDADGTMTAPVTLRTGDVASSSSAEASVTATTDGDAVVAWHNFKSGGGAIFRKVETRRVFANGTLGPLKEPASLAGALNVQTNAAGTGALLAWTQSTTIRAQSLSNASVLGTVAIPADDPPPPPPELPKVSASGVLAGSGPVYRLIYRNGTGSGTGAQYGIGVRTLIASGQGGGELQLDPLSPGFVDSLYALSVGAGQRGIAAWSRAAGTGGGRTIVKVRRIGPDGVPEASTSVISDATASLNAPVTALDDDGDALVAWSQAVEPAPPQVWARGYPASGEPGAPVQLSSTATGIQTSGPRLATAGNGIGIAIWDEFTGTDRHVVLRRVLPDPTCDDVAATVVQGRPTALTLPCTGVQLTGFEVVAAPRHGRVVAGRGLAGTYTPTPGFAGTDTFTYRARNAGGPGSIGTATIRIGRDTVAPRIRSARVSPKRARLGRRATLRIRTSEPVRTRIAIERLRACSRAAARKGCKTKYVRFGRTIRTARLSETTTVKFTKRLARAKLRAGSFRATVVAIDAAGNRSKAKRVRFTVVKRR